MATANPPFKRYCKVLTLKNDPVLIEEYQQVHAIGATWKEIIDGMKAVGILDMEIYLHGNQLFMIMDTVADFDHDKAMVKLGTLPRQAEWEAFVSKFQNTDESASAKDKWQLIPRIFELEQKEIYRTEDGQVKG
jgi:L-rhamnose mutarotase